MRWPFISARYHQAVAELTARLISDRDRRIADLEAERRMLWDKICLLGIGAPVFTPLTAVESEPASDKKEAAQPAISMRPSAIMRRMDRMAEANWLRKSRPSSVNVVVADQIFDQADLEVINAAKGK